MTLVAVAVERHINLRAFVLFTNFLLLKHGLSAATRAESTRSRAFGFFMIAMACIVCLVGSYCVLHLVTSPNVAQNGLDGGRLRL
jgi:hypothetical protein